MDNPFDDAIEGSHDAHIQVFKGFDLSAAGVYDHVFAPCPFCELLPAPRKSPDRCLLLTEHDRGEVFGMRRRWVKYVCCGDCGTCGPWGFTESEGLRLWNDRLQKQGVSNGTH